MTDRSDTGHRGSKTPNVTRLPKSRLLAAAGAGILLVTTGVWYGTTQPNRYIEESVRETAEYANHAAEQIAQACDDQSRNERPRCIKKAATEYRIKVREYGREQADLAVQRKVALWTAIMGIAALIGTGLSVIGVLLVWATFADQRKANALSRKDPPDATADTAAALAIAQKSADAANRQAEIAADTAQRQLRAYITVARADVTFVAGKLSAVIGFKNTGNTPAQSLNFFYNISVRNASDTGPLHNGLIESPSGDLAPGESMRRSIAIPEQWIAEHAAGVASKARVVFVYGHLDYVDGFLSPRKTEFRMQLNETIGFNPGELDVCQGGNTIS